MAVWNRVQRTLVLSSFGRLDAEYYRPSNLQAYAKVVNHDHTFVRDVAKSGYRVVYGNTKLIPQSLATLDIINFTYSVTIVVIVFIIYDLTNWSNYSSWCAWSLGRGERFSVQAPLPTLGAQLSCALSRARGFQHC